MSSRKQNNPLPPELWRTLALLRASELCKSDWQRQLGAGFVPLSAYLEMLPGTVADTYPDPQSGLPLIPRRVRDGTFTARADDPDSMRLDAVRKIPPAHVARHKILWNRIGDAAAGALEIEVRGGVGPLATQWVREIGMRWEKPNNRAALFFITGGAEEALAWLRPLLDGPPRLFALPFHDQLFESLAMKHRHEYVALDRDVRFVPESRKWTLQCIDAGEPAGGLRGAHFAIAPSFKEITDLKALRVHKLTNPSAIEALRALVIAKAVSVESAMPKNVLCEAVWKRLRRDDAKRPDYKPIQFFRVRRTGRTITLPIWGTLVRHDDRGYHWLSV